MQNVKRFRREHSDSKKQWSALVNTYITTNYFQMKLISIQEYKQFQEDLNQTLEIIHSIQQEIKNGQYSQKDTQLQFIENCINQLKDLSELITKCQKTISLQRSLNQVEAQSKTKSTQHLNQLLGALDVNTNNLLKFQQKYEKNQNQQIITVQREQMVQCEHQNSDKLIKTISNQEILRNLLNLINDVKSPKKQEISFETSSYKHQIQNLKCYKELKQNVEIMLKQTQKFNQCQSTQKGTKNYKTFMVKKIMESLLKVQFLYEFQSKCTMLEQEFINHLVQITGQLQVVKQNLQKLLAEKIGQQEVCAVLKLTEEISLCLQQKSSKYQGTQNSQTASVFIPVKNFNRMNEQISLIEDNMMKIHKIIKNQEEQLKNNKNDTFESGQNQHQSEDQSKTHTENTTMIPCVYSQQQVEEKIKQKLKEQTIKMEDAHKGEIERLNIEFQNLKNGFESKIKQLETEIVLKDSQILQFNQKQQREKNEIILQKKQSIKQEQIEKQLMQRKEEMKNALTKEVNEKRDEKNKLIEEVQELNNKINELNDKLKQFSSQEATLAVSDEQKKQQLKKLTEKIVKQTQAVIDNNYLSSINKNQIEMKAENQEQITKINSESFEVSLKLQFEKGKNQANQKQISSLKEQITKFIEQKIQLKIELSKFTLQIENHIRQKTNLKEQIKRLKEQHTKKITNIYEQTQRRSFEAAKINREKQKKLIQQEQKIKTLTKQLEQKMNKFKLAMKQFE